MLPFVFLLGAFFLLTPAPAQPTELQIEKLPALVNSPYDEFSPVVSIDGKEIFFTRVGDPNFNRNLVIAGEDLAHRSTSSYLQILRSVYTQIAGRPILNPVSSSFNQDIFIARSIDGQQFTELQHPPTPLNNALPNSLCAVTGEPHTFVIMNQFDPQGGMRAGFSTITRRADGSWTFPKPLQIDNYYTRGESVNLTMSADGTVLILSLQRNDSRGQNDLYVSFKKADGTFSAPRNLGNSVNSALRETTPALSESKDVLYFSSNRAGSGQNDIYLVCRRDDTWRNWSKPRRYKVPVNSLSDDSQPYFNEMTGYLYFTSRRGGDSDIYRVKIADPRRPEVGVRGKIVDVATGELLANKIFYGNQDTKYWERQSYASEGKFKVYIPKGQRYRISAQREGYATAQVELFYEENRYYSNQQEVTLYLTPLQIGTKIRTEPIYFARSTADLLPNSYPELERVATILTNNPTIKMEISGHTDNQGTPSELKQLSEQRARAVQDFLLKKGINKNRLQPVGYGAEQPLTPNADEVQRERNRRVEFKIIEN